MHTRSFYRQLLFIFLVLSLNSSVFSAPTHQPNESFWCDPLELVVPRRADLMAKYIYAKFREWNVDCDFGLKTYYEHLRVWNGFCEAYPPKRNFEDFLNSYHSVLDSIKQEGYNTNLPPIPLDSYDNPCNGAHRISACLFYKKKAFCRQGPEKLCLDFSFDFFRKRNLDPIYLDAMALQYCELIPNTYIVTIFPSASGKGRQIESLLSQYGRVVHKKEIFFTPMGGINFVLHAYAGESWLGEGNFAKAKGKARQCFPEHLLKRNPARIYLFEAGSLENVKLCKSRIRWLFNNSNDSVHINDTHEQSILLARALFNENSVHFLNHRKENAFGNFNRLFKQYQNWIKGAQFCNEWFCIDGSAVLAVYGLRDCRDLDYLHFDDSSPPPKNHLIGSHNHELHYHALTKDHILFDPHHYFYYMGMKFCSLDGRC